MVVNGGGRLSSTSPPSVTSSPTGRALQTVLGVDSEQPMARSKRRSMCAMRTPDPGYLAGRIRLMVVLAALAASRLLTAGLRTQGAILFESATLTTNGRTHCVSLADSPRWTVAPGATQDLVFVVDLDGLLCDILGESVDIELRYRSREGRSESFGVHYEKLRERSGGRLANEGGGRGCTPGPRGTPCPQDAPAGASFSISCTGMTCTFTNTSSLPPPRVDMGPGDAADRRQLQCSVPETWW
jgi:hypothetical protein